jgi:ABC-type sulfate transport system substrate-binding protein
MSLTVGEVLENAEYNEQNAFHPMQKELAKSQRDNYNKVKEMGADDDDDWGDWEEKIK